MNLRRFFSSATLIIVTLLVSAGIQVYAQTYAEPVGGPTSNEAYAPLDTGSNPNSKIGSLSVNSGGAYSTGLAAVGDIIASGNVCSNNGAKCLNSSDAVYQCPDKASSFCTNQPNACVGQISFNNNSCTSYQYIGQTDYKYCQARAAFNCQLEGYLIQP